MSEQEITEENLNEAFNEEPQIEGVRELLQQYEHASQRWINANQAEPLVFDPNRTWPCPVLPKSGHTPDDFLRFATMDEAEQALIAQIKDQPIKLIPLPAGISKEDAKHLDEQWAKQQEEHEPTDEELYVLDQQIKVFHAGIPQIERVMKFAQNLEADKLLTKATRLLDIVNIYKFDKERAKKALLAEFKVDVLLKLNEVLGQSEDDEPVLGYKTL